VFPSLNSSYYPLLRQLLLRRYPEHFRLLGAKQAWRLLLSTPRLYRDPGCLTSLDGRVTTPVPLGRPGLN
jgi:predicted transcriptional regulator